MPIITAPNGKRYDTKLIHKNYDPLFCRTCGERIGWYNIEYNYDVPVVNCEDCIAEMQED